MGRKMKVENVIVEEIMEVQAKLLKMKHPKARMVFERLRRIQRDIEFKPERQPREELPLFLT